MLCNRQKSIKNSNDNKTILSKTTESKQTKSMVSSRHYFIEPLLRSKARNSRNGGLFTRFIRVDVVVISSERSEHLIPQRLRFLCGFSVLIDLRKKQLRQDQRRRNKESCLSVCLNDTSLCLKRLFDLQTLIDDQIDRIDRVDWCRIRLGRCLHTAVFSSPINWCQ